MSSEEVSSSHPRWREISGKAPYPLLEEDAQAWVSRTRQESVELGHDFYADNILPGVMELAHEIEKNRLEAGLTTEELMEGLRTQRRRYFQEHYEPIGETE